MKLRLTRFLVKYFNQLSVAVHELPSLIGFFIFMIIYNQLVSGTMLAFSLSTEPMNIPLAREEEDSENLYTDDFFYLHERGVDLLVIFIFAHLFRKIYMHCLDLEQEYAWKTGVILFLMTQVVIFTGLVLCCTHLSDITLTIAVNAFHTFCFFIGKLYWLFAPDQTLNCDTILRLAYAHYVSAFMLAFFSLRHGVDMHYDWKAENSWEGVSLELNWYDEVLINELGHFLNALFVVGLLCLYLYMEPETLSYELFMWGDIGMSTDVRFLGVAPHWYFRPYMNWLITCPYHYTGLIGLVLFFVAFYFQPNILAMGEVPGYNSSNGVALPLLAMTTRVKILSRTIVYLKRITIDTDIFFQITYTIFLISILYTFSYLPFGKFFNRIGGNIASLLYFVYIFVYMSTNFLRNPQFYRLFLSCALIVWLV